jgi:hypothetical protein
MSSVTNRDVPNRALYHITLELEIEMVDFSRKKGRVNSWVGEGPYPIESISPSHNGRSMRVPALI